MLKIIIAGSRSFNDFGLLRETMKKLYYPNEVEVVCGGARGADNLGAQWARRLGFKVHNFPANWDAYGKRAGYLRNKQMGEFCDEAVIFWDGESKGAQHMINIMDELGKPVHIVKF